MSESSTSGAQQSKPDESAEEKPRRSREEIMREFKLALAIGDGSLLELDQDRARGVDPYDNSLGSRRAGLNPHGTSPGSAGPVGASVSGSVSGSISGSVSGSISGLVNGNGRVTGFDRPTRGLNPTRRR